MAEQDTAAMDIYEALMNFYVVCQKHDIPPPDVLMFTDVKRCVDAESHLRHIMSKMDHVIMTPPRGFKALNVGPFTFDFSKVHNDNV